MSIEHAWAVAIIFGILFEAVGMIAGDMVLGISGKTITILVGSIISCVIAFVIQFLFFNLDYSRTERLQFEDDEYYYYVKAVPKACVTTSERSIKKINGSSAKDERPAQDNVVSYANPIFHGDEKAVTTDEAAAPAERKKDIDSVDFEKKLEESLKNL